MSSSEDDDLDAFLASLRPKKKEEKYRISAGSLDDFVVGDEHVSFDEDSSSSRDSEESLSQQKSPSINPFESGLLNLKVKKKMNMDDSSASENQDSEDDETSSQNLSLDDGKDGSQVTPRQGILKGNPERGFLNHGKFKIDCESLGNVNKKVSNARDILKNDPLEHSGSLFAQSRKREEQIEDQKKQKSEQNSILDLAAQKKASDKPANKRSQSKRLHELRQRGSFTPKHSTADKSTSKSLCVTPKIIFSSDSDSGDENVFEKLNKETDAPAVSELPKPSLGQLKPMTSLKKPKKSSKTIILSDDDDEEEILPVACPTLTSNETIRVRPEFAEPSLNKETATVSDSGSSLSGYKTLNSRILVLSDDDEGLSPDLVTDKVVSMDPKQPSMAEPTVPHLFSTDALFRRRLSSDSDSPSNSGKKEAPVSLSSAKKLSRILVLSDDSSDDSDPDNDVIFIEDDYEDEKENLERNILESPDDSSSESYPRDTKAHIFDDVFKTPKDVPKKTYRKLFDEDDEEYIPLVSRILGGRRALEDSSSENTLPPQRRISEPKVCKNFTTPVRKPPKFCQTEKVTSKHQPQPRSSGIPPGLPFNCEKGVGFKRNRELLTKRLYDFFNETIFSSRLPKEMIVEWDKRLTKTAGVTKCSRRTVTTTENGNRFVSRAYLARIALSEKVLDTLHRLRDTLCHEMCHAAVWLIDNQTDGHGPYWKAWARKAKAAHPEMPVVKRCHSYDITYKYHYQCTMCRKIYGRHSKSIKVDKQACGVCKGRLMLQPQQNANGTPAKTRQLNKFALFVKENYKTTQKSKSVGGMTPKHSDVMKGLGEQFASLSTKK